jgi:hypothetical protein
MYFPMLVSLIHFKFLFSAFERIAIGKQNIFPRKKFHIFFEKVKMPDMLKSSPAFFHFITLSPKYCRETGHFPVLFFSSSSDRISEWFFLMFVIESTQGRTETVVGIRVVKISIELDGANPTESRVVRIEVTANIWENAITLW